MIAVGGVDDKNLADFLKAGFVGVGIGSSLTDKKMIAEKRYDDLNALAEKYVAERMELQTMRKGNIVTGIICALLLITSIGLIVGTLMIKKAFEELNLWTADTKRAYVSMAILIVYVLILPTVGFIISSVVMLTGFIQCFSKMKIWKTILISVAATLAVYFVFKSLLNVPVDFGMFYL